MPEPNFTVPPPPPCQDAPGPPPQPLDFKHTLFARFFADPLLTWAVLGATAVVAALHLSGIAAWHCPFKQATGLPCPGCGLTRSCTALLHGDFKSAVAHHAFGPLFLAGGLVLVLAALLPRRIRRGIAAWLAPVERRCRLNVLLLAALLIYTLTRWFLPA
ncbi:MAG: DUF2752 domain-containing protein [Verrucomicrobiales bacterium]|nr:DUF2752 domain-containing protein [Verrucomicrobiales bacterium]